MSNQEFLVPVRHGVFLSLLCAVLSVSLRDVCGGPCPCPATEEPLAKAVTDVADTGTLERVCPAKGGSSH